MFFLYKGMLLLSSPRAPAPQAYVHSWIHELVRPLLWLPDEHLGALPALYEYVSCVGHL